MKMGLLSLSLMGFNDGFFPSSLPTQLTTLRSKPILVFCNYSHSFLKSTFMLYQIPWEFALPTLPDT